MDRYKVAALSLVLVGLMVAVWTTSASAAMLCASGPTDFSGCPTGKREYSGTISATATNFILTSSITNVTCAHSAFTINASSSTGTPVSGQGTALSFTGNCKTSSGTACTITVTNIPYHMTIEGKLLVLNDEVGVAADVVCGFLINCQFYNKAFAMTIANGSPTTINLFKQPMETIGGFCPATASLHATYSVTSPSGFTVG